METFRVVTKRIANLVDPIREIYVIENRDTGEQIATIEGKDNAKCVSVALELLEPAINYFSRVDAHLSEDFNDVSAPLRAAIAKLEN